MSDYILSCCTTADLPADYYAKRQVPFACFRYTINGESYIDDCGKAMSFAEFYRRIAEGAMPTTSQVNAEQYKEMFEPYLQAGKDVLHLSLSSGISNSYNSACIAREELAAKYPARKLYVVDTLAASAGFGLLVDIAADRRDAGATVDELHDWVEGHKLQLQHWFFSSDLTHLKRGGRVSATAAAFGSLLNICPLMNVDKNGKLIPRKKVRGRKQVIAEMVDRMEANAEGGLAYNGKCYISHANCYEDARATADLIEARFKHLREPVQISWVGAVIGSHTGPGTVALFFYGNERVD